MTQMIDYNEQNLKDFLGSYYDSWYVATNKYDSTMDMVREYVKTANQPSDPIRSADLIMEEYNEWMIANHELVPTDESSHEAELKELADLVYVIYGLANAMGYNLDEAIRRVHQNNMERMFQDDGTIKRREDGKIIKNPSTPSVYLGDLV